MMGKSNKSFKIKSDGGNNMAKSKNEYPMSEDEYVETVQKLFKEKHNMWSEEELNMLYDDKIIDIIKSGYKTDCWYYDNGQSPDGYFDVNNQWLGNRIFSAVRLAIQFPEFLD